MLLSGEENGGEGGEGNDARRLQAGTLLDSLLTLLITYRQTVIFNGQPSRSAPQHAAERDDVIGAFVFMAN